MPYESERGDISMIFSGDTLISRALMPYREEPFLKLRDLMHSADVRFTNGEMLFHDYDNPPGYLYGMYVRCDPRFIKDLQWIGINLLSCANNHAFDFGANGVLTNIRNLNSAGLVHAGTGRNYAAALAPSYLDTAQGRVALVSATSTAPPHSRAGEQRRDMHGRPGANVVRWINEWTVDERAFDQLRRVAETFSWPQREWPWWKRAYGVDSEGAPSVYFADRNGLEVVGVFTEDIAARFVQGNHFERRTRLHLEDLRRNVDSVSEARRMAEWVIFSIHNHEGGLTADEPAPHVRELAHAVVDAGADVVIGHGPHRDRGIEIYQGKPIFYSLGAFVDEWETIERMPQDVMLQIGLGHDHSVADLYDTFRAGRSAQSGPQYWSAIPRVSFKNKQLESVTLHPIQFEAGLSRSQAGRPLLAEGDIARQALEHLQRLSETFGTHVDIEGDTGVIACVR